MVGAKNNHMQSGTDLKEIEEKSILNENSLICIYPYQFSGIIFSEIICQLPRFKFHQLMDYLKNFTVPIFQFFVNVLKRLVFMSSDMNMKSRAVSFFLFFVFFGLSQS